jgi:hypothetical protein
MRLYKRNILVYGVGVNDADYNIRSEINGKIVMCIFYITWADMLKRCYSEISKNKYPTYIGCCVCNEWLIFSNFKKWMETKDFERKQLDKDLKVLDNKVYSPNTCMFVSNAINNILNNHAAKRGAYPQGVCLYKKTGKYKAQINFKGKRKHIGYYTTIKAAELTYLTAKHEIVLQAAKDETDQEVSEALYMQAGLILDKHNTLKQGSDY